MRSFVTENDLMERRANALAVRAIKLLSLIIEELDITSFTFKDITESFNYHGKPRLGIRYKGRGVIEMRFDHSHLQFLVRWGLIVFCPKTRSYAVTDAGLQYYES